jgi:hypothetical protein
MAAFVPVQAVSDMLAKELESALTAIAKSSATNGLRERAIAA